VAALPDRAIQHLVVCVTTRDVRLDNEEEHSRIFKVCLELFRLIYQYYESSKHIGFGMPEYIADVQDDIHVQKCNGNLQVYIWSHVVSSLHRPGLES
jgi:hypothetical protein